ncbi:glutamate--tRNA ligase [Nitratiruptor sp. YY09-18]|uniref:glutamate--tRNA ligase n=1 Tax=Nitratiruptor sp. YY09-18 TaxID=2724901 RepID=UPI001916B338|nr:glutamate--tRNA ligase [Nitratiruptor sp. YY09-18]BCD68017.1 glutamyl-tRNA synthetase [Nitratiruptor sp. YY09-18]
MLRFAPSPTGDMHIGNLRVAILNFIVAKQRNERFIIRIEDTDRERNIEGKDKEILAILDRFGITYDDVVYQSKNLSFHQNFAYKLLDEGKAFACFCTAEELEQERQKAKEEKRPYRYSGKCENITLQEASQRGEPFVVRIKKPDERLCFEDKIKGDLCFDPFEVDSFVILRADGRATYNFACAIDDMLYDITLVIRGEDHLSNTPKQIHVRKLLGYDKEIAYAHLPIILNEAGKKMSKREKASSVKWLLDEGFLPQAIANYLILLGNKTPKEVFTLDEAIEWFDLADISKSPAKFDIEKLRFINRAHLKALPKEELAKLLNVDEKYADLAKLYLEEASTLKELKEKIDRVLQCDRDFGEFEEEAFILKNIILDIDIPEDFDAFKKILMERSGLKGKKFFKPLRLLLTGAPSGPEMQDIYNAMKNSIKEVVSCSS